MEYLEDLLNDLICDLETTNNQWYNNIEMDLYEKVYGDHIDTELAKEWVASMENKDGTSGEHWTLDQTSSLAGTHDKNDFYVALNMMWSDHYNPKFDTQTYAQLASDWLDDKDIDGNKLLKYYFYLAK